MTEQEKQNINSRINELISVLVPTGNITDCVLFVRGDAEYSNAAFTIKGDSRILANAIQHHLTANKEFRKFMLAMLGSYLSGNPEEEKLFLNNLLVIKNNLGTNFKN